MTEPDRLRVRGLSDDDERTLNRLRQRLKDKRPRNLLRSAYYDGRRTIRQVGTVIPPQYYKLGLVLGWSAKAVDLLARRCNLNGFVWPDGDLGSIGLDELVDRNFLYAEFSAAAVSSLLHGVVFSINTAGDPSVDEPKSLVHFKDALNATGDYNSRTRLMDNLISVISRNAEGEATGYAMYLDGETITIQQDKNVWGGSRWSVVDLVEHDFGVPVDAIVHDPRSDRPWGRSRISRAVMSKHDQALRTVIRLEGHMDVYSFPEMWMLGADSTIFKNADGSVKPVWQTMLARIKGIPDDPDARDPQLARADVKQFPASSPAPHLDVLKQQAQLFAAEVNIPVESLGLSDRANPTSADSYIASRDDLIFDAESATAGWTPPLRRTIARALAIQGGLSKIPDEWLSIDAKWRSPVHLSRAAEADAGSKQVAAVPWLAETEVGLELIGLSPQQIKSAMADRRRATSKALTDKLTAAPVPAPPAGATEQAANSGANSL